MMQKSTQTVGTQIASPALEQTHTVAASVRRTAGLRKVRLLPSRAAAFVPEWLNAKGDTSAGRRLAHLVENIQRYREISSKHWRVFAELRMREEVSRPPVEENRELQRLEREIHQELGRYKMRPMMLDPLLATFGWEALEDRLYLQTFVVAEIITLANDGLLERLRRCKHCLKWLFAKKSDQHFCGGNSGCRQKHYESDPDVKQRRRKQNRDRMRRWRHAHPSRRAFMARSSHTPRKRSQNV
jgi:hypothetical protein